MAKKRFMRSTVAVIVIFTLCIAASIAVSSGSPAADGRGSAADWTILGLDVPDYVSNTGVKVAYEERQWVHHHKLEIRWKRVQPSEGGWQWSYYDKQINAILSDKSQSILLTLGGPVPEWARDGQYGSLADKAPPQDLSDWYRFCAAVADRYGAVVDFYEIWNEPGWDRDSEAYQGFGIYHFGGQVETDYLPLLQLGYTAIKEKDPTASVICGALMYSLKDDPNKGTELYAQLFDEVNRPGQDVSVKVEADKPIVAERPMYFNYNGAWAGGHDVVGAAAAGKEWYFAEGTTRDGFEEWLCLQNPNEDPIQVTATFMFGPGQGPNQTEIYALEATSRTTLKVNDLVGPEKDISIRLTSGSDFIAERPMYFNYNGVWAGGHDSMGATTAQAEWYFADGCTRPGFNTWLCLQNPGDTAALVYLDYFCGDGINVRKELTVNPRSRFTVPVHQDFLGIGTHNSTHGDVSIKVSANQPIVAERPMYFNYNGAWAGGHDAMGATSPQATWYFAEGCTGFSIQEYLCLQNPQSESTQATLTFMMTKGEVFSRRVTLAPFSRTTLNINMLIGFHGTCDMVAVHPYKSPWYWGGFYTNVVNTLRSRGAGQEVVTSEIGWPHYSSYYPGVFSEAGQAAAIGNEGVKRLFDAGCRKIWLFKDIDDDPADPRNVDFFGLFSYTGQPHAAWHAYVQWQRQLPSYPDLPSVVTFDE